MGSIKVLLYKSKKLANGEHPVMIRYIKDRKPNYISIGKSCSTELWDDAKELPKKSHPLFKELTILIGSKKLQAEKFILAGENNNDQEVTSQELRSEFKKNKQTLSVFKAFEYFIARMLEAGQVKNSQVYKDALRQLKKFTVNKDLSFSQIDISFLNRYQEFMQKTGLGPNSIYLYLRTLRALINKAIEEKICLPKYYSFKEFSLAKFSKIKTQKRAISKENIIAIASLEFPPTHPLFHSRNYFLFSYYNRGINMIDIAHLQWSNISNNRLNYRRKKTRESFTIGMLQPAIEILNHYSENKNSDFIFPILSEKHDTPSMIQNRIHKMLKVINRDLKEIAVLAGINEKLTTYVARHSFATILKKSGVSTSLISEAMGHDSEKTTQIYLEDFENSVLDDATRALL